MDSLFNSSNWVLQVQGGDQPPFPPMAIASLRAVCQRCCTPCVIKKGEDRRKKKKRKFYIYLDVTHTHAHTHTPGRSRVNPERQKEEKSGHDDGQKPEQRRGEGNERASRTNLRGETDLTKTEHTPKPHDTLRRGTQGELGAKWGLVNGKREKPKQLI